MSRPDPVAAVDRNFRQLMSLFASAMGEGFVREFGPFLVAATGLPVGYFNAVFAGGGDRAALSAAGAGASLRAAGDELHGRGLPYVVHLGPGGDTLRSGLLELGLVPTGTMPGMAMEPRPAPRSRSGLRVVRVGDEASLADHRVVAAAAFGLPANIVDRLMPAGILAEPGLCVYVGYLDTTPVASGLGYSREGVLGVYNIGTLEWARGRGYGTAMTWAALSDAGSGVGIAILQASDAGRPVYERIGFRTVLEYEEFETE